MLGRYILVLAVLAATIALTARSSFSETTACRSAPGAPAPQGLHWYYRADRTDKRHCWFLVSAGTQVRLHKNVTTSNLRSQVAAEQVLASPENDTVQIAPSQLATAEAVAAETTVQEPIPNLRSQVTAEQVLASPENDTVQIAPSQLATAETVAAETTVQEPSVAERAATDFAARWLDLPKSVDLDAGEFAAPRRNYATEPTTSDSNEQMTSTWFVAADTGGGLRDNPVGTENFGSIFLAGALGILLFGGVLRLTRAWHNCPWRTRTANDLAYEPKMSLAELMRVLRRTDEALKSAQGQVTEILTNRRISNPGPRAHSALSLGRDRITGGLRDIGAPSTLSE